MSRRGCAWHVDDGAFESFVSPVGDGVGGNVPQDVEKNSEEGHIKRTSPRCVDRPHLTKP